MTQGNFITLPKQVGVMRSRVALITSHVDFAPSAIPAVHPAARAIVSWIVAVEQAGLCLGGRGVPRC